MLLQLCPLMEGYLVAGSGNLATLRRVAVFMYVVNRRYEAVSGPAAGSLLIGSPLCGVKKCELWMDPPWLAQELLQNLNNQRQNSANYDPQAKADFRESRHRRARTQWGQLTWAVKPEEVGFPYPSVKEHSRKRCAFRLYMLPFGCWVKLKSNFFGMEHRQTYGYVYFPPLLPPILRASTHRARSRCL